MNVLISLVAVLALSGAAYAGAETYGLRILFGIVIPYLALAVFIGGVTWRILKWARVPVPFRIPTTCGQQKSLPWIKPSPLDNPSTNLQTVGRMALEVLFFRSLLRNSTVQLREGPKLVYISDKTLWIASLAFHWSFLVIVIRHFRFFIEPVPFPVRMADTLDSFFQIGLPLLYFTDLFIVAALTFLVLRRLVIPQLRYISLPADYFPLFLILGIALSGVWLRYFDHTDITAVKGLAAGLFSFHPVLPEAISPVFYVHLLLVSVLLLYFPFGKLMHAGGVFLSPTRNLPNDNRMRRHVNPWNYPVKLHTYEEYEDEFRDKMIAAEIPVDKEA